MALLSSVAAVAVGSGCGQTVRPDPLPSWRATGPRKDIVAFVERVTQPGSPDFVPPPERIAVFDNDGTLWSEQPVYVQLAFVFDRHVARR